MPNLKFLTQFITRMLQESVVDGRSWNDEMDSERGLTGAHRPNMQIVNSRYASLPSQMSPDFAHVHALRSGIYGKFERIAQQTPCAQDDDCVNHQTHRGIKPVPASREDGESSDNHTQRNSSVRGHMRERAANIQVALATRHEKQRPWRC